MEWIDFSRIQSVKSFLYFICCFIVLAPLQVVHSQASCPGGQYLNTSNSQCYNCTGNTYCDGSETCQGSCNDCPPNSYPNAEHTDCVSGTCLVCPIGSYCEGLTHIVGCPVGTYGNSTGLKAVGECTYCAKGTYNGEINKSTCVDCDAGRYSSGTGFAVCNFCEAGTYLETTRGTVCLFCKEGKYGTGTGFPSQNLCQACLSGKYSTGQGMNDSNVCSLCANGKYSTEQAANSSQTCVDCQTGKYSTNFGANDSSTCKFCEAGKYQESTGSNDCQNCSANFYSPTTGNNNRSQCIQCDANSVTLESGKTKSTDCVCDYGYKGNVNGNPPCFACSPGFYADSRGSTQCLPCPENTYDNSDVSVLRVSLNSVCQTVPLNSYSPAGSTDYYCEAGYKKGDPTIECSKCPIGKYSYRNSSFCSDCINGNTQYEGSEGKDKCLCNAGYYKLERTADCVICPKNSFCTGGYNLNLSCPPNTVTLQAGAENFNKCFCEKGYYGNSSNYAGCEMCPQYSYCPGLVADSLLYECPSNTMSAVGSFNITNCSCRPGYQSFH